MNKQELLELITNGENSYVEFKEEAIKAKDLGEELLRLFEASGSIHYDISAVPNTSIRDLNIDIIRDYFLKYNNL